MTKITPLVSSSYYHIYNRGNNRENIFCEGRNYDYFLKLCAKYILPIADTYAYCLLKNHFHFLVRINEDLSGFKNLTGLSNRLDLSNPFSNFFNAYAKAYNRTYDRAGALFQRSFGRILVANEVYLVNLIAYIHQNPQKHGFVADFREWPFSSYHVILSERIAFAQRESVLTLFRGREQMEAMHRSIINGQELIALAPDDFD
jgi:putative transposase